MAVSRAFLAGFLFVVLFGAEGIASACQCRPPPSFEKEVERAEVIFLAQPERIRLDGDSYVLDASVTRVFKGNVAPNVALMHSDCPPNPFSGFVAGPVAEQDRAPMLVYGYSTGKRIILQPCGRSKAASLAADDVERLTAATTTRPPPSPVTTTTAPPPVLPDPARIESRPASGCGCVVRGGDHDAARSARSGSAAALLVAVAAVLSRRRAKRF
jgi:hypothetical protein